MDGKKLATYTTSFTGTYPWYTMHLNYQSYNVYFAGRLISAEGNAVRTDRLGSVRAGGPGNLGYQAQFPYGAEYGTATANDREKYATYTRDSLTGLDYAVNRYYSSQWGRFLSPDPYTASAGLQDPQSWNRYAYVGGDPVNANDPDGLQTCGDAWVGLGPGNTLVLDPTGSYLGQYTPLGQLGQLIMDQGDMGLLARTVWAESDNGTYNSVNSADNRFEKGTIAQSILDRMWILDGAIPLPPGLTVANYSYWGPAGADLHQVLNPGQYAAISGTTGDIKNIGGLKTDLGYNYDADPNDCDNIWNSWAAAFYAENGWISPLSSLGIVTSFQHKIVLGIGEQTFGSFGQSPNTFFGIPWSSYTPKPHKPPSRIRPPRPVHPPRRVRL